MEEEMDPNNAMWYYWCRYLRRKIMKRIRNGSVVILVGILPNCPLRSSDSLAQYNGLTAILATSLGVST